MKKIITLSVIGCICMSAFGQIRTVNAGTNIAVGNSPAFIDGSSNTAANGSSNVGKGLIFPRVDLTSMTSFPSVTVGLANSFPTYFDGMVVYNTATSGIAGVGNTQGTLTPGYWYYSNNSLTTTGGTWKPLGSAGTTTTQISLTSAFTPAGTSPGQVAYNTSAFAPTGLVYWDGTKWQPIAGDPIIGNEVVNATPNKGLVRSGSGTVADPYTIGIADATVTGQALLWDGTKWVPGTIPSSSISGQNITAASNKLTVTGGTGAALISTTVDVNESNLTITNMKAGGGTSGQILTSNGIGGTSWITPSTTTSLPSTGITGAQNITAASSKVTVNGGTGASLVATSVDVNEGNLTITNMKAGGGTSGQILTSNGIGGTSWTTPSTTTSLPTTGITGAQNITAASNKVTVNGGTGASLVATSVDVNEANLTLANLKAGGTSGQVLTTNGAGSASWVTPSTTATAVPATGVSGAQNITAASNKVTVNGGTGASLVATSVDVNEANLTLANMKTGGGTNGQMLTSNGAGGATWTTPTVSVPATGMTGAKDIVTGTSVNTATSAFTLINGSAQLVGNSNATITINNTAPLWDANQLQSINVSTATPTDGQLLRYNSTTNMWEPYTVNVKDPVLNTTAEIDNNYSATTSDDIILFNASQQRTLTLPTSGVTIGKKLYVLNKGMSGGIDFAPAGVIRVDAYTVLNALTTATLMYIGNGKWDVVSGY
jgi:hypothetical protein